MNSEFVIAIRKTARDLPPSDEVVARLHQLCDKLVKETEKNILKNERIGKNFLKSNIQEITIEQEYVEAVILSRLNEMRQIGLDEYNNEFSNTKEVAHVLLDAIHYLKKLWKIYFEEPSLENPGNSRTIIQNAEKIYNIDKIDNANFS